MKRTIFATLGILALQYGAIASAQQSPSKITLHSVKAPPVWLGDNDGHISDVMKEIFPVRDQVGDVRESRQWTFTLPKQANLEIDLLAFSLTRAKGCDTSLSLNGETLIDSLAEEAETAGSRKSSQLRIRVDHDKTKAGENTLTIRENECSEASGSYNDSLIQYLAVKVLD